MRSSNIQKTLRKLSLIPIMTREEVGVQMRWEVCTIFLASPSVPRYEQILTTPENTITYHNALCLSPQNFAQALFSVSLGAILTPKRNWGQCLCKSLGWQNKEHYGMLWYFFDIEIVSCRLLQRIARMDMDWKLKKLGQLFQVSMPCLQKWPKIILASASWNIFRFDIFSIT